MKHVLAGLILALGMIACEEQQAPLNNNLEPASGSFSNHPTPDATAKGAPPELLAHWDSLTTAFLTHSGTTRGEREAVAHLLALRHSTLPGTGPGRDFTEDYFTGEYLRMVWYESFLLLQQEEQYPVFPQNQVYTAEWKQAVLAIRDGRFLDPEQSLWDLLFQVGDDRAELSPAERFDQVYALIANGQRQKHEFTRPIVFALVYSHLDTRGSMYFSPCDDPECQELAARMDLSQSLVGYSTGAAVSLAMALPGGQPAAAVIGLCGAVAGGSLSVYDYRLGRRCSGEHGAVTGDEADVGGEWGDWGGPPICNDPFYGCSPSLP